MGHAVERVRGGHKRGQYQTSGEFSIRNDRFFDATSDLWPLTEFLFYFYPHINFHDAYYLAARHQVAELYAFVGGG